MEPADVTVLGRARTMAGLTPEELWSAYFGLGGNASRTTLDDMLAGRSPMPALDHDIVAVVLNEHFDQAGFGRPLDHVLGSRTAT